MNKQQELKDWLRQNDGKNNWGWQVIVDALAIGENLPLRIIRYDSLQNLYESIIEQLQQTSEQQCDSFKSNYPDKAAWDKYVVKVINWANNYDSEVTESERFNLKTLQDLAKVYSSLATDIFPVLPANPFPMEMLSRISFDEYRVFCLLWFYHWIVITNQSPQKGSVSPECNGNALAFPAMNMASQWLDYDAALSEDNQEIYKDWLMIIGPCFGGNIPMFSEEKYDDAVIRPVVKFIEHFSQAISQERLFHEHRFHRAAHESLLLPWEELKHRQERVEHALSLLLACDITALNNTPTRHDLYHITLWALFSSLRIHDIEQIVASEETTLIFHYGEDYSSEDEESGSAHPRACLAVKLGIDNCMQLSVRNESTAPQINVEETKEQISQYGFVLQFESKDIHQPDLKKLRIQCSRFYLRVNRKRRSLDGIRLMIISDRLHRELGNNTSSLRGICQWLSGLLRSESTVLYRYDTHERAFGKFSVKDKFSRSPANDMYLEALTQDMENIGTEEELEKSLTYRAVKDNESKICLMYDPVTTDAIPIGNTLYHSEDNKDSSFRSAVAVPIRFNGRRQGAIEVSAYRPWQFSWGQQLVMEQAASVIAPYFYNQRFLEALSRINHEVLEFHHERLCESELYDGICRALANMFLCDGASFWVRKKNERHILEQKGSHNIKLEIVEIDMKKQGLISNMVSDLNFDKSFVTVSLSSEEIEQGSMETKNLCGQNVRHLALLPLLRQQQTERSSELMAAVTLYTRDTIGFKDSWNGIMHYMSGFLPFVVEAVNAFVHERKAVTDVVQHEIWHDVAYLANKAAAMARDHADLRQRLIRLSAMVQSDWFINQLIAASILQGWRREDIESVKELQHAADSILFLPQRDMQYFAETLRTRINALFNDRDLTKDDKKLQLEIGDRNIAKLILSEEQNACINIKSTINLVIEKNSEINRKGLHIYIDDRMPDIFARKSIVTTVLRNLLDNAVKYSSNNTAITIEAEERRSGAINLMIINEGRAMIDLNECFDALGKGIRGSNAKPKPGENDIQGQGVGLYTVQKLCKHQLRFDFSFKAEPMGSRADVWYIATLNIPASSVLKEGQ
ncbi:MAG: sensor histidine kinase [Nitrosomonas oligotropha]|uniref:Sensor histidine kinase n=1 Tax=Nitrosomonas oligotropha TaxID=42354 RepID=A0A5C7VTM7_9PROT|nr:MAG: sensor histidine kinase [Nitrosomonas oligotropha]